MEILRTFSVVCLALIVLVLPPRIHAEEGGTEICEDGEEPLWFKYPYSTLRGFNNGVMDDVEDIDECFEACLAEESFECRSIEYSEVEAACHFSTESKHSQSQAFWASNATYYEWWCPGVFNTTGEEPGDGKMSPEEFLDYMREHPAYVGMVGLAIMIVLLVVTAIVILCCMSGGGGKSEKS